MSDKSRLEDAKLILQFALSDLLPCIAWLLELARQASSEPYKERSILSQASSIYVIAEDMARLLNAKHRLPAIPAVNDARLMACCPACGHEDHEDPKDMFWRAMKIHRGQGKNWTLRRMRRLLPDPVHQQFVIRGFKMTRSHVFTERRDRFKTVTMSCTVCQHCEETLAIDTMDFFVGTMYEEDRPWWTTQHPEILLLRRWQVPESRMARFDREQAAKLASAS